MTARIFCVAVLSVTHGCASWNFLTYNSTDAPTQSIFVPADNFEFVWERTVEILHVYQFQIARENKSDGLIETEYKVGSGLLEPWHRDSVGMNNRLESSLQSIRRKAFITLTAVEGGFLVAVEVHKEREDVEPDTKSSVGGATFQEHSPLQRNLNEVIAPHSQAGWMRLGRDTALEEDMLHQLHHHFLSPR